MCREYPNRYPLTPDHTTSPSRYTCTVPSEGAFSCSPPLIWVLNSDSETPHATAQSSAQEYNCGG